MRGGFNFKTDMALTQEEIRIRAGLDYSKVTAGLTDIRRQVYKLAMDVPKQLGNVFKASVFSAGASLIGELKPLRDTILDVLFGFGPAADERLNEATKTMEQWVAAQEKILERLKRSRDELFKASRNDSMERGSGLDKQAILEAELADNDKLITKAQEKLRLAKASGKADVEARIQFNEALAKQIALNKELEDVRSKFTDEERNTDFARRNKSGGQAVARARQEYRFLTEEMQAMGENGDYSRFAEFEAQRKAQAAIIQRETFDRTARSVGALPNLPMFDPLKNFFAGGFNLRQIESKQRADEVAEAAMKVATSQVIRVALEQIKL
jgi:hypothetical protein